MLSKVGKSVQGGFGGNKKVYFLEQLDLSGNQKEHTGCKEYGRDDPKEPCQVLGFLTRDWHVHAPQTSDQVHGEQNTAKHGQLGQDIVRLVRGGSHLYVDLGQVVGVGPGKDLFVV